LDKAKTKRRGRLGLSKIGFFTLILHREFPENQVSQVCVKLNPSGRIHVSWLNNPKPKSSKEPKKAVGVDLGITRLATLSDGRILENPRPHEHALERIRMLQSVKEEVSFE